MASGYVMIFHYEFTAICISPSEVRHQYNQALCLPILLQTFHLKPSPKYFLNSKLIDLLNSQNLTQTIIIFLISTHSCTIVRTKLPANRKGGGGSDSI